MQQDREMGVLFSSAWFTICSCLAGGEVVTRLQPSPLFTNNILGDWTLSFCLSLDTVSSSFLLNRGHYIPVCRAVPKFSVHLRPNFLFIMGLKPYALQPIIKTKFKGLKINCNKLENGGIYKFKYHDCKKVCIILT